MGNSQNLKDIGEFPAKANANWVREAKTVFTSYCKSPNNTKYEQRSKVIGSDGNYFFTITPTNTFYLILVENEYPERQVFQLIEEFQKENIHLLTDEKGELSKLGKQSLKNLIENYQKNGNNKIANVNNDIEDIKIEMNQNIKKIVNNLEDAEELKKKSDKIKDSSRDFNKKAGDLKRATCWQNCKWNIILAIIVIGVLLAIIIPLASNAAASSSSNSTPSTSNPSSGSSSSNNRHGL
jgi:hypothetical protein